MNCPHCGHGLFSSEMSVKDRIVETLRLSSDPMHARQIAQAVYGDDAPFEPAKTITIHIHQINAKRRIIASVGKGRNSEGYILV